MDKTNLYSADKARKDLNEKIEERSSYVNEDKILLILSEIKAKIAKIKIDSDSLAHLSYSYPYDRYLSNGEIKFLKDLGYQVERKNGVGRDDPYWDIIW